MSTLLLDTTTFETAFEFDCELSESAVTKIDWTEHPIEDGADISDFGVEKQDSFVVEGLVTASPWGQAYRLQRVIDIDAALRSLAKKKQPVTIVARYWVRDVVIDSVDGSAGQGQGDQLQLSIAVHTIKVPKPSATQIPASRIKLSKRKRAAPVKKGGSQTGTTPTGKKRSSALLKGVQILGG